MAKLSINALVGLFTFTDAAGHMHWDHVFVTELLSNSSYRPVHDFIMGAEYTAVARVRRDVPKKHRSAIERLLRLSHRDGTPVYRCEPTEGLRGQYRDPLTHCLGGESLLLTGYPGTGKTHLARKIVEALRELGDTVHIITKTHAAVQNVGLGAQLQRHLAGHRGAEVCRELKDSQLLHDLADGWCHELSERWRFDAEQVPLREAVQMARQRFPGRGEPEVCLVISHAKRLQINERENRRQAPQYALLVEYAGLLVEYAGPETAGH
ncbi:pfh1 [Symbiodinium sp. CCMP2456]|nr:pfh1 [Symbiodinium sp. CCMP2456]